MTQPKTPEPCPECNGNCCVNYEDDERSLHVEYAKDCSYWARVYVHSCPDCDDGTYGVRSEPEPWPKPVRTAEEERADVVAWLNYARSYDALASARFIASGGHVGWAKGEKP